MNLFSRKQGISRLIQIETVPNYFSFFDFSDNQKLTQDWRDWRNRTIGPSVNKIIVRENRWQSRINSTQVKLRLRESFQPITAARSGFSSEVTNLVMYNVSVVSRC